MSLSRPLIRSTQYLAHPRVVLSRARVGERCISTVNKRQNAAAAVAIQPDESEYDIDACSSQDLSHLGKSLSAEQRKFLESALRVNHAGELAAVLIYAAQKPSIIRTNPHLRDLMQHMYDQEASHFKTFNELLAKHRIRPTIMYPVWKVAATTLGWSTAVMGREAAMACTEAVETEIGEHYNNQVRVLIQWAKDLESRGEPVSDEMRELLTTLRRIRDEELEHLDSAVENDAKEAKPYELLTNVIRGGCRAAIWVSEKI